MKSGFHSASAKEITIQTASKFASTANHGAVNNSVHLNSVTSIPEGLNVKRSDPRVSHDMLTLKVNRSKPQQLGTFVIKHQTEKSVVLPKKVVIPFPSVLLELKIRTWWKKNNCGYFRTTTNVLQKEKWILSKLDVVRTFWKLQSCMFQFVISNQQNSIANSITKTKPKLLHINPLRWKSLKKQLKQEFGKLTRIHGARGILSSCQKGVSSRSTARHLGTTKTTRWNQRCNVADKNVQWDPVTVQEIIKPKNVWCPS